MKIISYICIAQITFSIFFLLTNERRKTADLVLIAWLILLAFPSINFLLRSNDIEIPVIKTIINPAHTMLYGPFLLLYTMLLTRPKFKWTYKTLLHLTPFILFFTMFAISGHRIVPPGMRDSIIDVSKISTIEKTIHTLPFEQGIKTPPQKPGNFLQKIFRYYGLINLVIFVFYSVLVILELRKHRKKIVHHFSNTPIRISLKWLIWVTASFVVSFLVVSITESTFSLSFNKQPILLHSGVFMFFIYALSYFGIKQQRIYKENVNPGISAISIEGQTSKYDSPKIEIIDNIKNKDKPKYINSGLKDDVANQILKELEIYMKEEKPFIEFDLTISDLSQKMNVSKHHLTQVINTKLNKNFYQFINEFRVQEVINKMKDPENDNLTLLAIAYDSGFNSKSGFYTTFKRITGHTPSQYKKKNSKK